MSAAWREELQRLQAEADATWDALNVEARVLANQSLLGMLPSNAQIVSYRTAERRAAVARVAVEGFLAARAEARTPRQPSVDSEINGDDTLWRWA